MGIPTNVMRKLDEIDLFFGCPKLWCETENTHRLMMKTYRAFTV